MFIDTHCHLFYENLKSDLSSVLSRAKENGVGRFICVGTNLKDSAESLDLAKQYDTIYATAGIHPHDAKDVNPNYVDELYDLINNEKMVAIGEIGLDYYRSISDRDLQKEVFVKQMQIASKLDKPIVFHNRDADEDVIKILSKFPSVTGVAHCFSSDLETAKTFLKLGYYISFSGNLTFKNSHLPDVAKGLDLDRILIETDSPFLSPEPHRGKQNEPSRVWFVAKKLSEIFNVSLATIEKKTSENAKTLFNF
tara:strand:- start:1014 stop:1769 length:756 start_codon:yes stop_codon:yes gene_type:complete